MATPLFKKVARLTPRALILVAKISEGNNQPTGPNPIPYEARNKVKPLTAMVELVLELLVYEADSVIRETIRPKDGRCQIIGDSVGSTATQHSEKNSIRTGQ